MSLHTERNLLDHTVLTFCLYECSISLFNLGGLNVLIVG
jgi:hypothetical protein